MDVKYEDVLDGRSVAGGFARVRKVRRKADGVFLARKRISYSSDKYANKEEFQTKVEKEIAIMQRLEHPNIVQYFDYAREADLVTYNIYMEFCDGQNLEDHVEENKRTPNWPSQQHVWSIVYQLSAAVAYCHSGLYRLQSGAFAVERTDKIGSPFTQVLHRDIKPRNVLLQRRGSNQLVVKLCDFGLGVSLYPEDVGQMSYGGTRGYIAPEITKDEPRWSTKADVFSLGCTLYYLAMHELPWQYQLTNSSFQPASTLPIRYVPVLREAILKCIEKVPGKRPEADVMFHLAFEHVSKADIVLASLPVSSTNIASSQQESSSDIPNNPPGELNVATRLSTPTSSTQRSRSSSRAHQAGTNRRTTLPSAGSHNSSVPQNSVSEASENWMPEILNGLGSFLVDFRRHPPLDALYVPKWSSLNLVRHPLSGHIAFKSSETQSETQSEAQKQRRSFNIFKVSSNKKKPCEVAIQAKESSEFLLRNSEDYVKKAISIAEVDIWMRKRIKENRDFYVVIGYITYLDARVMESQATGRYPLSIPAAEAPLGVTVGDISSSSFLSGDSNIEYEKSGEQIQAVLVRKVILHNLTQEQYNPRISDIWAKPLTEYNIKQLDDVVTWYFWGPKQRPI